MFKCLFFPYFQHSDMTPTAHVNARQLICNQGSIKLRRLASCNLANYIYSTQVLATTMWAAALTLSVQFVQFGQRADVNMAG